MVGANKLGLALSVVTSGAYMPLVSPLCRLPVGAIIFLLTDKLEVAVEAFEAASAIT
jgi:hypothetical protein